MPKHRIWFPTNRPLTMGKKKNENIYIHKEVFVFVMCFEEQGDYKIVKKE